MIRYIDQVMNVPDIFGRRWAAPIEERCPECGQPYKVGSGVLGCNHIAVDPSKAEAAGGKLSFHEGKEIFHATYAAELRKVAKDLGLKKGEYEVTSNKAGTAILGDVILHADHLYVSCGGSGSGEFMFRSCKSRKDYTVGSNHWAKFTDFRENRENLLAKFRAAMEEGARP